MVRPVLSDRYPVCPVCNVGVLWPNGWMDQDATWYGGIGLGLGRIMLDGDLASPTERGTAAPLLFGPLCCGMVARLTNC